MSSSLPAKVFAGGLRPLGFGEPQWQPEPTASGGAMIGDVGHFRDGRFFPLFNAILGSDSDAPGSLPEGFVKLEYDRRLEATNEQYLSPIPICSSDVTTTEAGAGVTVKGVSCDYTFKCTSEKGAVLIPGDYATHHFVHPNTAFTKYVSDHHASWVRFAQQDRCLDLQPEDIVLVTGTVKTSSWTVAALYRRGTEQSLSLGGEGGPLGQARLGIERSHDFGVSAIQRNGPRDATQSSTRDQCLFIQYYKAKYRRFLPMAITAHAEPRADDVDRKPMGSHAVLSAGVLDNESDAVCSLYEIEPVPRGIKAEDPLDILLDRMLSSDPCATMAITCHDDLVRLRSSNTESSCELHTFLQSCPLSVSVNTGGVANIDFSQPEIPLRDDTQSAAQGSASSHTARGIQDPLSSKTTSHENTSARYASSAPPAHHVATRAETRAIDRRLCKSGWQARAKTDTAVEQEVKDYADGIDSLLVFAGLFSAVITSFLVESCQYLQPDNGTAGASLLRHAIAQNYSMTASPYNATSPYLASPPFEPPLWALRVNVLWFASLVCSLATAVIALPVKMWLREHLAIDRRILLRGRLGVPQDHIPTLARWLPEIVVALAQLLHLSLALFTVGLCFFTAAWDPQLGNPILTLLCAWVFSVLSIVVMPLVCPRCPYKHPMCRIRTTLLIPLSQGTGDPTWS